MPPSMQYITSLLSSTPLPPVTTSPLKVRVDSPVVEVEYTIACSTHTARPGGILLQVGLSLINIDREYRGGGVVEETEENEGGDASVE